MRRASFHLYVLYSSSYCSPSLYFAFRRQSHPSRSWPRTPISSATCRKAPRILFLLTKYGVISSAQVSVVSAWRMTDPQKIYATAGQVYYALLQEREAKGIKDIAISRVEQISPFPYDLVCPPTFPRYWSIVQLFPRSLPTLTRILMRIFSGAKYDQF